MGNKIIFFKKVASLNNHFICSQFYWPGIQKKFGRYFVSDPGSFMYSNWGWRGLCPGWLLFPRSGALAEVTRELSTAGALSLPGFVFPHEG